MASVQDLISLHEYKFGRPKGGESAVSALSRNLEERNKMDQLFQLEQYKNKLDQEQQAVKIAQQKELIELQAKQKRVQEKEQREYNLDLELAKMGVEPDTNRQMSGEIERVSSDKDGAILKRGVSQVIQPEAMMSLPSGEVGDVTGKIIPRREKTLIQPRSKLSMLAESRKPPEGYEVSGFTSAGKPQYKKTVVGIADLPTTDQIQARALARRLYGVRGAEKGLPTIVSAMSEGRSVDEIEDLIRTGRQSTEFAGSFRGAAQSVTSKLPQAQAQTVMDYIDDNISRGDIEGAKNLIKKAARDTSGVEMSKNILGKERTIEFLSEIQNDLDKLEQSGVDTNIFSGSVEEINKKIGRVNKPELRKVATKIAAAIQNYRRSMSGVAFSVPESQEYKDMFPSIGKTANFNRANIEALKETMSGDINNFYSMSLGQENYKELFSQGFNERKPKVNVTIDSVETPKSNQYGHLFGY